MADEGHFSPSGRVELRDRTGYRLFAAVHFFLKVEPVSRGLVLPADRTGEARATAVFTFALGI